MFGQYILTPEVFQQLETDIRKADAEAAANGGSTLTSREREIELTSALDEVRRQTGMMALRLNGERFDMGNPAAFVDTIQNFGKR